MDRISTRSLTTRVALLTTSVLLAMAPPAAAKKNPDETISEIQDKRIAESSGLALSMKHDDLVYTMNDEGGNWRQGVRRPAVHRRCGWGH